VTALSSVFSLFPGAGREKAISAASAQAVGTSQPTNEAAKVCCAHVPIGPVDHTELPMTSYDSETPSPMDESYFPVSGVTSQQGSYRN
jgi:hypothetical protein